ncbi:GNAT family N-acetyltransferase [Maribacter litopenaei]|uniref:GNAT family N-acetyltransferase n=1 Tax=Maribacter litopenaei TaxID=2976127 RepID=A0ABY5Y9W6_9FLAO|nr:GNAT family N-acetyltransferase [Maribacter litopenaei]UWX55827.1 GNAT family N-acetyltransferase [Maribacter litopenaei]
MDLETNLRFVALTPTLYHHYITIGTRAYNQHYKHLWPNGDTSTYIEYSFTRAVLLNEEMDMNTQLYLIQLDDSYVGIFKITLHKDVLTYPKSEAFFLDKIYILKEFSGRGIGSKCIKFVEEKAKKLSKKAIFLECMQKEYSSCILFGQSFFHCGP